jgi:hypothetical protein
MNSLNWRIAKMMWHLWRAACEFGEDEAAKRYVMLKLKEIAADLEHRVNAQIAEQERKTTNPELYAEEERVHNRTRMFGER